MIDSGAGTDPKRPLKNSPNGGHDLKELILLITFLGAAVAAGLQLVSGQALQPTEILNLLFTNRIYQAIIVILIVTNIRHILFRLRDQEV